MFSDSLGFVCFIRARPCDYYGLYGSGSFGLFFDHLGSPKVSSGSIVSVSPGHIRVGFLKSGSFRSFGRAPRNDYVH